MPLDNLIHTSGGQERLVQVPLASRTIDSVSSVSGHAWLTHSAWLSTLLTMLSSLPQIGIGIVGSEHTRFELRVARLEAVYSQAAEREVEY